MACRDCKYYLDVKDCDEQNQREMSFCGFGGACVHPTNFLRVVYLTPTMVETGRCGREEQMAKHLYQLVGVE